MDLRKTTGYVATSDFFLWDFPTRVRRLFLNLLLRFLTATQEMDFNFFAGLSVWGLFNEDPIVV